MELNRIDIESNEDLKNQIELNCEVPGNTQSYSIAKHPHNANYNMLQQYYQRGIKTYVRHMVCEDLRSSRPAVDSDVCV